jgi:N-acetylglutamate synthase-like GNAT family acetyltransferase
MIMIFYTLLTILAISVGVCNTAFASIKPNLVPTVQAFSDNNALRLREVVRNDEWEAVRRLRHTYFFAPHGVHDPYEWTFTHAAHKHFLLYRQEEKAGYAHVQLWSEQRAIIRIIVIEERLRQQHLGKQFMHLLETWLAQQGSRKLCLEAQPGAVKFFERCGFQQESFTDPEGYASDVRDTPMQKKLEKQADTD